MRYGFIRQQQRAYPITVLCRVMEVNRSGYCRYLQREREPGIDKDFELIARVRQISKKSRDSYGSRRIASDLSEPREPVGRCRARSLMKKAGVSVKQRRKLKLTTDSNHPHPVAPTWLGWRLLNDVSVFT